jgi:hypothetical protein
MDSAVLTSNRGSNMQIGLIHKHFDQAHLEAVKTEMLVMGAPVIKAVWVECHGVWAALEGCHRIRAAQALGLTPEIEEIEYSDETLESLGLDVQDGVTVSQIADDLWSAKIICFAD